MKTVGTLTEIGANVGDIVTDNEGYQFTVEKCDIEYFTAKTYSIVAKAKHQGPVRTVTRKEIVPGVYGDVVVTGNTVSDIFNVRVMPCYNSNELTAAIETLTQIRDAMK